MSNDISSPPAEIIRCPACQTSQPRLPVCRRCRCDLRLLGEFADTGAALRRRTLACLTQGRVEQAIAHARNLIVLRPDGDTRRLLAVCLLYNHQWVEAASIGLGLIGEESETSRRSV